MQDHIVVIVGHYAQRLAKNNGCPDEYVAHSGTQPLLDVFGDSRKGNLTHHAHKGPDLVGL